MSLIERPESKPTPTQKQTSRKKTMSNRANALKSTGPKTEAGKAAVRLNAQKHGLLSKTIFLGEAEQLEFENFLRSLDLNLVPVGPVEQMLVQEIAISWCKLQAATKWEVKEFRSHRAASKRVVKELQGVSSDLDFLDTGSEKGNRPQWECDTVRIRHVKADGSSSASPAKSSPNIFGGSSPASSNHERGCVEIETTLNSSLPTILRYETHLKRDFYKAINTLRDIQERRKESQRQQEPKRGR